MKPSNMLVLAAVATSLVACHDKTDVTIMSDPDRKGTRWILEFDENTELLDQGAFEDALNKATDKWERKVKIGDKPVRPDYTQIPPHDKWKPTVTHYPRNTGGVSQHVTQRVGLYHWENYRDVVEQIKVP